MRRIIFNAVALAVTLAASSIVLAPRAAAEAICPPGTCYDSVQNCCLAAGGGTCESMPQTGICECTPGVDC